MDQRTKYRLWIRFLSFTLSLSVLLSCGTGNQAQGTAKPQPTVRTEFSIERHLLSLHQHRSFTNLAIKEVLVSDEGQIFVYEMDLPEGKGIGIATGTELYGHYSSSGGSLTIIPPEKPYLFTSESFRGDMALAFYIQDREAIGTIQIMLSNGEVLSTYNQALSGFLIRRENPAVRYQVFGSDGVLIEEHELTGLR